jgi:hypothetical protein
MGETPQKEMQRPAVSTTNQAKPARLAQSVERETLTQGLQSQGCGFDPHVGLNSRRTINSIFFRAVCFFFFSFCGGRPEVSGAGNKKLFCWVVGQSGRCWG